MLKELMKDKTNSLNPHDVKENCRASFETTGRQTDDAHRYKVSAIQRVAIAILGHADAQQCIRLRKLHDTLTIGRKF